MSTFGVPRDTTTPGCESDRGIFLMHRVTLCIPYAFLKPKHLSYLLEIKLVFGSP